MALPQDRATKGRFSVSTVTAILIALLANVDRSDMAVGESPRIVVFNRYPVNELMHSITATGISYLFRYCGQVFGVGLSGGVLQAILATQLKKRITGPGAEELIDKIRKVSTIIPSLEPEIRQKAIDSYKVALRWVFVMNGLLAVLNFLISLPVSHTCIEALENGSIWLTLFRPSCQIKEYPLPGSFEEEQKFRDERDQERENSGTSTPAGNRRQT